MIGDIFIKAVKDVTCEEWGWAPGKVVIFCNIYVTEVSELGSGVNARTLGAVAGSK